MKPEGRGIMEAKGVGREDSVRQRELHMEGPVAEGDAAAKWTRSAGGAAGGLTQRQRISH